MNISEIMTTTVSTITSDKSVSFAAEKMNAYSTDALVVVDHGELMGVVTSRQLRSTHPNRIVADAMNVLPIRISPEDDVWETHALLQEHDDELLLVMNEEELVGVVTREDVQLKVAEFIDPLTGLYRAPYIQYMGEKLLREGKPFHMLFIDVNDFGKINKRYGHPFGDDVIRMFSVALSEWQSNGDTYLCRYAGDEFVMITTASDEWVKECMETIDKPTPINDVMVSAAVGHLDGFREPDFFDKPLREHIARASLLSTKAKMNKESMQL
ncbi:GGDEF domain-containing protein [Brevibacillus centrosporus]|uniref:GGDEF domain-containing protein n=1 Tax=Brevibacillus centrosporus TaxID=54910 RepID=UPI00380B965C